MIINESESLFDNNMKALKIDNLSKMTQIKKKRKPPNLPSLVYH